MDTQDNAAQEMVSLMTLHGAKGLEFDVVFLPGWEEGVFPNQRALDETGVAGLEEERRLAYVGLTRARTRAFISHAANRQVFGSWLNALPSRFVEELPAEVVEREGEIGENRNGNSIFADQFNAMAKRIPAARPYSSGDAFAVSARPRPTTPYKANDRVFHQKFGYGTVAYIDNDKLEIEFDMGGMKKVMDSFVVRAENAR